MFNGKKRHFKRKLDEVRKMIWDFEFKRFKVREIREEIRQEYDALRGRRQALDNQIEAQKGNTTGRGEIARLGDERALMDRDAARFVERMKTLDAEVEGTKATADSEGVQGINQQLDALRELQGMIEEYIKGL